MRAGRRCGASLTVAARDRSKLLWEGGGDRAGMNHALHLVLFPELWLATAAESW